MQTPRVFEQNPLLSLPLSERTLFTKFGLGDAVNTPFKCIHHAFEFHASMHAALIAVEDFEHKITYGELDRQSNCLATRLRAQGVAPGSRVCLLVERSILMVVGILGILKAGAAYIPLDGNVVSDKTLQYALKDSGSSLILVLRKFVHRVGDVPILCLEDAICQTPSMHCSKPQDLVTSNDSAYIIYTSGTTGVPKGVDVMHRNVTNLVCIAPGNLGLQPGSRISQLMNISFDMAAWEILGSLCNGSTLCLRGKTSKEWRAVMKTVDVVIATPSMLAPHDPADYPTIKAVAVAGEPCPRALADNWGKHVSFYNCCGPTEVTIVNTMHLYSPGEELGIGGPTPNNTVYVLDENLQPVRIGEMGIMWAGGTGITRGYLNLPEKTAEKYRRDPFIGDGSTMFNTGDLGRWLPNGNLEHLGRVDHQVKVNGFRVELDGVAAALETCPGVNVATAMLIGRQLWGFYTPSTIPIEDVKAAASKVQPYYAVPAKFLRLDKFPETSNGKVDKRALERLATEPTDAPPPIIVRPPSTQLPYNVTITDEKASMKEERSWISRSVGTDSTTTVNTFNDPSLTIASFDKKVEPSSLEAQTHVWAGYEQDPLPDKTQGKFIRNLRHQIMYLYRRLFGIVFIINLGIFISICIRGANAPQIGQIVVANLFVAILMRQDYIIDAFFTVFCSVPRSWPISIRRVCARVYHIGGLHSGCGVSGVMWLILFTAQAIREVIRGQGTSPATLAITCCILACLLLILVFAYPKLRQRFHDNFEATHRFLGWTTTALVWAQTVLLTNDYKEPNQSIGGALKASPSFWLVVIMTGSIILPWLRLRKVNVSSERLSSHAVRLSFDYVTPGAGSFVRISDSPLTEWHSFATIPIPGKTGFSLVVSRAGDWTAKQIENPPSRIWVRGIPTYGVMRIAPLFRRLVVVATGSGIGPCTPAILQKRVPMRVLWTAPNVRETFGDKLVDTILEAAPDAVIYNTRQHGKPDMVKLTYRLVKEFDAEAVVIISNQKLTEKVVYGMMSRGIPAFGAIWDS